MDEFIFNIHDITLIIPILECVFFVAYRMSLFSNRDLDNSIFNAFLISIIISTTATLVLWNEAFTITPAISRCLPYFLMVFLTAKAPLLYLYVQSSTQENFSFKKYHLLHALPAIICVIIIIIFSIELKHLQPGAYNRSPISTLSAVYGLWDIARYTSIGYGVLALVLVCQLKKSETHSQSSLLDTTSLLVLVGGFLLTCIWSLVIQLFGRYIGGSITDIAGVLHNYLFFIYINVLGVCSLRSYNKRLPFSTYKHNKHGTLPLINSKTIAKVKSGIENKEYYLEPNITLEELSLRVGLPIRIVSGVINKHFNQNFFDYINGYRIKAAKTMLVDPTKSNLTVLDILYMSGFSSTSSFHRYFKRIEGITPTEYRRINSSN